MNSVLEKLRKAGVTQNSQFLAPNARYRLEVQAHRTNDGHKGMFAIAEMKVISVVATKPDAVPTPVASSVAYMEKLNDPENNGGGRFNAYLLALVGEKDATKADDLSWLFKFFDERQAGTFLLVDAETWDGTIKKGANAGKSITKTKFSTVTPTPEEFSTITEKRAKANLKPLAEVLR